VSGDKRPDRGLNKNVKVGWAVVVWFALTAAGELLASLFEELGFGKRFWQYGLNIVYLVVPVGLLVLLWLRFRRPRDPDEDEAEPVKPVTPPRWYERAPLIGRVDEVRAGVSEVRANGVVVVVGPRDIGTSAVGQGIVQKLIDDHKAEKNRTYRFDLRSRSARGPDDAAATAGRVVSPFGIAMPADDSAEVLARVAGKLVDRFRGDRCTLMLDNVSTPEQVGWLVREWPTSGPPYLVIAGEPEVAEAFEGGRPVTVGQLEPQHLRAIWEAELAAPEPQRARRWRDRVRRLLTAVRRRTPDDLDRLLPYLLGRPKAVELLAAEIRRTDGRITVADLVRDLGTDDPRDESASGPLVRVWKVILGSIREGLSGEASWLLDALSELPVTGLTRTTVKALLQGDDESALDELWDRKLVEEVDGRFRVPQELRRAIADTNTDERRATVIRQALPALLAFYAQHVGNWAVRLDKDPAARTWFETSEESLWPLVSTEYYRDDTLLEQVLDDLTGIADGLEKWYVREQKSVNLRKVGQGLFALAERVERPDLAALGAVRTAIALRIARRSGDATTQLDLAEVHRDKVQRDDVRRALETRIWVERALLWHTEAEDGLSRVTQSATVLLNRAVLCIARDAIDEAHEFLDKAERLAAAAGDSGCVAHSVELRGIALSQKDGQLVAAATLWQRARVMYENLGEKHGEARCLQHLGAAAITDTRVAAYLRDGTGELPVPEAADKAVELLELAKDLRAGQPDTGLTDHYLAEARAQLP
jgi:hypothetical protein